MNRSLKNANLALLAALSACAFGASALTAAGTPAATAKPAAASIEAPAATPKAPATLPSTNPAFPAVGDTAPDFTLSTPAGQPFKLSALTAKSPIILIVLRGWPGYQCPFCTRQVADLLASQKSLLATGARILLVYPGPADGLKAHADEFIEGKTIPEGFTLLIDPDYAFTSAYHLRWNANKETAYPSTFIIDTTGVIRFAKVSKTHAGRATAAEIQKALDGVK